MKKESSVKRYVKQKEVPERMVQPSYKEPMRPLKPNTTDRKLLIG